MKQIGKHLRNCSLIMYNEMKHLLPGFLLIMLILLASHLLAILLPQKELVLYSIFYFRKFTLWRMDQLLGIFLCLYLLASQLWKQKQRHLLRYELLPLKKGEQKVGRMLALACFLCIYCFLIDIFYIGGYKIITSMHPELAEATGLFQAVENAYYIQFLLPTTLAKGIWLILLILVFSFFSVTLEDALLHPLLYLPYLLGAVVCISMLSFWYLYYHMPLFIYEQLVRNTKLQELCYQFALFLQENHGKEMLITGWSLLAVGNLLVVPRRLTHRREKGL